MFPKELQMTNTEYYLLARIAEHGYSHERDFRRLPSDVLCIRLGGLAAKGLITRTGRAFAITELGRWRVENKGRRARADG